MHVNKLRLELLEQIKTYSASRKRIYNNIEQQGNDYKQQRE